MSDWVKLFGGRYDGAVVEVESFEPEYRFIRTDGVGLKTLVRRVLRRDYEGPVDRYVLDGRTADGLLVYVPAKEEK